MNWQFFIEVLVSGLLAGVMYSLVALGFVLIYKASGVFNFAQGAMVFFAALTFVSLIEHGVPVWFAIFLGWLVKSLITRYGGAVSYRRCRARSRWTASGMDQSDRLRTGKR
jgi:branched-subunit amino acid ABC-type transport system permease component